MKEKPQEVKGKFEKKFSDHFLQSMVEALTLIKDKNDYAGGFETFAKTLEQFERTSSEYVRLNDTQAQLRVAIKEMWDTFLREASNRNKMEKRLREFEPSNEDIEKSVRESRESTSSDTRAHETDRAKYLNALRQQQVQGGKVEFINPSAKDAFIADERRKAISRYADSLTAPVRAAFEKDRQQIAYIGALYNNALPSTIKMTQGWVQQLLPPKNPRLRALGLATPEAKKIPVTANSVRTEIVNFLVFAENQAREIARLELQREDSRSSRNS